MAQPAEGMTIMFNIGFSEFLTIGVIALLVIGPKQLPEMARVVGRLINEFKRATQDITGGFMEVSHEVKDSFDETRREIMVETEKIKESIVDTRGLEDSSGENHTNSETGEDHENQEINNSSEGKEIPKKVDTI